MLCAGTEPVSQHVGLRVLRSGQSRGNAEGGWPSAGLKLFSAAHTDRREQEAEGTWALAPVWGPLGESVLQVERK